MYLHGCLEKKFNIGLPHASVFHLESVLAAYLLLPEKQKIKYKKGIHRNVLVNSFCQYYFYSFVLI